MVGKVERIQGVFDIIIFTITNSIRYWQGMLKLQYRSIFRVLLSPVFRYTGLRNSGIVNVVKMVCNM